MIIESNGKTINVPRCTCGKCIVRRMRKGFFDSIPYNKNLASNYANDYDWKTNDTNPDFYNRSKHSGFEGCYKEHLPTGLMSTMKADYKPFKVQLVDPKPQEYSVPSVPFFGRTSYRTSYPNWGAAEPNTNNNFKLPDIKIPLRGSSNYHDNYIKHPERFYKDVTPAIVGKDTLEFYGKLNPNTTFKSSYKPIDFNQAHYFTKERPKKGDVEKSSLMPADFPKSNFDSSYNQSFIDYKDKKCELSEYLTNKGLKHLEI